MRQFVRAHQTWTYVRRQAVPYQSTPGGSSATAWGVAPSCKILSSTDYESSGLVCLFVIAT